MLQLEYYVKMSDNDQIIIDISIYEKVRKMTDSMSNDKDQQMLNQYKILSSKSAMILNSLAF